MINVRSHCSLAHENDHIRDVHLLADSRLAQEVAGWQDAEVTILLKERLILLEDLGVHNIRRDISILDVLAEFRAEFSLNLLEVQGLHGRTGPSVNARLLANNLRA